MANEIKVSTNRLKSDADQVNSLIQKMEQTMTSMKSNITQLGTMWEGPTKKAFMAAFESDRQAADGVLKELKAMHSFEEQAKTQYERCENQVSSLVSGIRI
ncbi:MAG: WXG100 family type VII secretion target [Lachnospiraceae bacterium]|nr:WXG100 family type VII secretion target [Lachnospiraceae bacterium]